MCVVLENKTIRDSISRLGEFNQSQGELEQIQHLIMSEKREQVAAPC